MPWTYTFLYNRWRCACVMLLNATRRRKPLPSCLIHASSKTCTDSYVRTNYEMSVVCGRVSSLFRRVGLGFFQCAVAPLSLRVVGCNRGIKLPAGSITLIQSRARSDMKHAITRKLWNCLWSLLVNEMLASIVHTSIYECFLIPLLLAGESLLSPMRFRQARATDNNTRDVVRGEHF